MWIFHSGVEVLHIRTVYTVHEIIWENEMLHKTRLSPLGCVLHQLPVWAVLWSRIASTNWFDCLKVEQSIRKSDWLTPMNLKRKVPQPVSNDSLPCYRCRFSVLVNISAHFTQTEQTQRQFDGFLTSTFFTRPIFQRIMT